MSLKLTYAVLKPLAISVLGFILYCVANIRILFLSYYFFAVCYDVTLLIGWENI